MMGTTTKAILNLVDYNWGEAIGGSYDAENWVGVMGAFGVGRFGGMSGSA